MVKYSEAVLDKALTLSVRKEGRHFKCISKEETYSIMVNPKTNDLICTCWWFTMRTCKDKGKYGFCSHILAVLYNYNKEKFDRELRED